jgi:hypothetical protein
MGYVYLVGLIVAGILALSGFIVAKKPDAKALIDKLVPFQAFVGVGLLVLGVLYLLTNGIDFIKAMSAAPLPAIIALAGIVSGIVLGALFGMPQIAKWIPGESNAEQKAVELSQKAAPYQMLFGVIALGSAVGMILLIAGILKAY